MNHHQVVTNWHYGTPLSLWKWKVSPVLLCCQKVHLQRLLCSSHPFWADPVPSLTFLMGSANSTWGVSWTAPTFPLLLFSFPVGDKLVSHEDVSSPCRAAKHVTQTFFTFECELRQPAQFISIQNTWCLYLSLIFTSTYENESTLILKKWKFSLFLCGTLSVLKTPTFFCASNFSDSDKI